MKMQELNCINLSAREAEFIPFSHLVCPSVLERGIEKQLYEWFEHTNEWSLTEEDFYTQYEFVLSDRNVPDHLRCVIGSHTIDTIQNALKKTFTVKSLETVSIVAHKLVKGHKIGVHNDYINSEETHRLVVQINPNWDDANGGFLMLFHSPRAEDVSKIIRPINNSAFGFEISDRSYHAVSTVHNFSRYSVVYTFKKN
ncbi:MAG TPA: cyclophane-containing peptide 2OG-Fe(II) oxygenase YhhC [Segetibacter sp.]|jgi:Rps23 Pro-64 3,4-dihydroxylase Tpa1-like proline 4-hydroxylase